MRRLIIAAALLAFSSLAQAWNYATCLLDKLPGVQNHGASVSAVRVCQSKYPGGLASVEQGAGRGLFASYDSGDECTYDKAKDTRYTGAVRVMAEACMRLYNNPAQPDPVGTKYYREESGTTRKLVPFEGEYTPLPK
ncbi:hypothetical protein [Ectopseudomonas khazarica]|uniref:hypothetical protein n=1 Tax=Ectopseudomonas khazarica TaxID=2502979 RepID=UPI003B943F57